jgi:methyl-accepting chemotaxis protein
MGILNWFGSKKQMVDALSSPLKNSNLYDRLRRLAEAMFAASTEQAAAIQQAIASMSQMRSMLAQTNEQVQTSLKLSEKTSALGEDGANNGELLKHAMDGIVDANSDIEKMREVFKTIQNRTRVIHEIVFKTQLLSLNASIEASRAGQYGKGFAVVAEEVGRLALTSGKAAKEIDLLLGESQTRVSGIVDHLAARVKEGMTVSEDVRKSFSEIGEGIHEISHALNQVSEASREQLLGIEQTSRAMDQMNATTEDNRRNAEQIFDLATQVHAGQEAPANPVKSRPTSKTGAVQGAEVLHIIDGLARKDHVPGNPERSLNLTDIETVSADDPTFKSQ